MNTAIFGFLWIAFFFALCFVAVHAVKLLCVGWNTYKKKSPPKAEEKKEEKAPAKQEPIYYIVERKRRRPKAAPRTSYGETKQISFK